MVSRPVTRLVRAFLSISYPGAGRQRSIMASRIATPIGTEGSAPIIETYMDTEPWIPPRLFLMEFARYILLAENEFGFEIEERNKALPLVIDPVLLWSTYIGGEDSEEGYDIAAAAIEDLAEWLRDNCVSETEVTLIHNDYKLNNVVLRADDPSQFRAVLDWDMCTRGEPLFDLATLLRVQSRIDGPQTKLSA